jgi:GTP cyclohydrolase I
MSLNKNKVDPALGLRVHQNLVNIGVETPMIETSYSVKERIDKIETHFQQIMDILGLDREDDSLQDTPNRVAKMYVTELFYGLDTETFPKCTTVENKFQYNEMVVEKGINVMSVCEHHFVGIVGTATVAYIPNKIVLGLSKLNRIVEYFSRRPQVQERLTAQIFHTLCMILNTEHVAIVIEADHYCVKSRGIEDTGSSTVTSMIGGAFKTEASTRNEFMMLARKQS